MSQGSNRSSARVRSVTFFLLLAFLVLICELLWLQLIKGEILARRARDQRIEAVSKTPLRGTIYDRNMQILAGAFHEPALVIFPQIVKNTDRVATLVANTDVPGMSQETALSSFLTHTWIYVDSTKVDIESLDADILGDPGVVVINQPVRYDPKGLAAHVIGYLDQESISGISGIEKVLDAYLNSGKTGLVVSFMDARRMPYEGLGVRWLRDVKSRGDVVLTIDRRAQEVVEEVMDRRVERGAVVVMEPKTGQVLAMASRPSFSGNRLGKSVLEPLSPMIDRAITSYPAGSVLKVAVAACGLEKNVVTLADGFYDPGFIDVGLQRFKCHLLESGGHGHISFLDAMAYSCNSVFIDVALKIGGMSLVNFYERLGLGASTGISLPFEQSGSLPGTRYLSPQDTANLALGQGEVLVTPLQVAVLFSAIANGGELISPKLVLDIRSRDGVSVGGIKSTRPRRILSQDTCRQLTFMLESVTRWGTGKAGWVREFGSCGKTGTAETGRPDSFGRPICHAWFAGFTPLQDPRFVIVVFVEEGGSGGDVAAPIFKEIAEALLYQKQP